MPTKKKSTKKKGSARRAARKTGRKTSRRRSPISAMGMGGDPTSLVTAIVGGLAGMALKDADFLVKMIPEAKWRYAAIAGTAVFGPKLLGMKIDKQIAPALIGMAVLTGVNAGVEMFPKLLPASAGAITGLSPTKIREIRMAIQDERNRISGRRGVMTGRRGVITGQRSNGPAIGCGDAHFDMFT